MAGIEGDTGKYGVPAGTEGNTMSGPDVKNVSGIVARGIDVFAMRVELPGYKE